MLQQVIILAIASACVSGSPIDSRVVNGSDAQIQDFPFAVSLRAFDSHICGGSLLNEQFVLTAAHCVEYNSPPYLTIQYGSTNISDAEDAPNVVRVTKAMIHENYTSGTLYNDVAVLMLEKALVFSDTVQAVKLPPANNATPENAASVLVGWGLNATGGWVQTTLQKVDLVVYPDEECERIYSSIGPTTRKYNICSGVPEGGKGQCSGDSGGPLLVDGVIVGTVSWSIKPCTIKPYPGVYGKVSTQVDWILRKIEDNS